VVRHQAIVRPLRLAVATMLRFSPPFSSVTIIASDRIPSSGNWNAIERSVEAA